MSKIIVENNKQILDFQDPDKLSIELLKMLGVTSSIKRKEIKIRYDEKFRDYLEKDRQPHERTVKDYKNYLKSWTGELSTTTSTLKSLLING
ncbi:MAG: hypothetical protein DRO18_00420 [Thermoprotei archaeon]|mgnify:CR=1 FL=1|nr:MAG: hypothetical protein DRO18_00420 [Thermoprotei archaeon]